MTDVLRAYSLLSFSSTRSQVSDVLQAITDALPFTIKHSSRSELIQLILKDLKTVGSKSSRLTQKDASRALLALKTLGKTSEGSEILPTSVGLSTLLSIATTMKDDHEACCEALKCIANTMLLYDEARHKFITKEVGGGDACIGLLHKTNDPEFIFILCRILFLATASPSTFLISLVEDKRHGLTITELLSTKLDVTMVRLQTGTKSAREAMTELVKFIFNLLLHYPQIISAGQPRYSTTARRTRTTTGPARHDDDLWSSKLDGFLVPLLRVYHSLPPTFPSPLAAPLTHVIHALVTIPVTEKPLTHIWLGSEPPPKISSSSSHARPLSMALSPRPVSTHVPSPPQPSMGIPTSRHSIDAPPSPMQSSFSAPIPSRPEPAPKQRTLDKALSVLSAATGRQRRSPSPLPPAMKGIDVLQRTQDLLEVSFAYYMPGCVEPDSLGVKERVRTESSLPTNGFSATSTVTSWKTATTGSATSTPLPSPTSSSMDPNLSDLLYPLVSLLTRLCKADPRTRIRVANWLIPPSLFVSQTKDSSPHSGGTPLYKSSNFLGRCLRILISKNRTVAKLRDGVGELLWVASGQDAWVLSSRVGYGCVRDLLESKGIMQEPMTPAPTPPPKEVVWDGVEIMDIRAPSRHGRRAEEHPDDMESRAKEAELDKMFGILDRLERVGGPKKVARTVS